MQLSQLVEAELDHAITIYEFYLLSLRLESHESWFVETQLPQSVIEETGTNPVAIQINANSERIYNLLPDSEGEGLFVYVFFKNIQDAKVYAVEEWLIENDETISRYSIHPQQTPEGNTIATIDSEKGEITLEMQCFSDNEHYHFVVVGSSIQEVS